MTRMQSQKSFREYALDPIMSFMSRCKFSNTLELQAGIAYLISVLNNYTEEGKHLFPEILFTTNIDSLKKFFITPNVIWIGDYCETGKKNLKRCLKECAPLSISPWVILIELSEKSFRYGVISSELNVGTPPIFDQLKSLFEVSTGLPPSIYLKTNAQGIIHFLGNSEDFRLTFSLEEDAQPNRNIVNDLTDAICYKIDGVNKSEVESYFRRSLNEALRETHGTLIGIIQADKVAEVKSQFEDGLFLPVPIHIPSVVDKDFATSNHTLASYTTLLKGIISHDGITILSTEGHIYGCRAFISKPTETGQVTAKKAESDSNPGGARWRAFKSMKESKLFEYCFYLSQDGRSELWKSEGEKK